jgi:acyl-coenzyme A thioesterase PaaI-like protein
MLVIAPLVLLLIGGIVASMVQATGEVVSVRAKNNLTYNLQDALNRVENDIELSVGFLATTDTAFDINTPQGVNNNTDFLRAVTGGTAYGVSEPVHRGRRQQLWLVTIRDDRDRLIARGHVRLQNLEADA